jgi:hypothetical protein
LRDIETASSSRAVSAAMSDAKIFLWGTVSTGSAASNTGPMPMPGEIG